MNKTDRLLAIVLELQRKGVSRAEDLAAAFETSVRTIYRDMQALSEAGVPIIGEAGRGYSLMAGYFLPPVSFSVEEAVALLVGADFVEQQFDESYGSKALSAKGKIEAILPDAISREAARTRTTIRLIDTTEARSGEREKEGLRTIRRAILEGRKVRFKYSKRKPDADGKRQSLREAAPYGLVLVHGSWILLAHCDLRQELRHFRLSRMIELAVTEERYQLPPDFRLEEYKVPDDRNIRVRVLAKPAVSDFVQESTNFFMESTEETKDGLLVTFRVRDPEDILQWVLGWGAGIIVLEPDSFRKRVKDELKKMLKRY
ncbi:helix-turn-helix transcriptional regulator [Cohnella faecalis]|uniref:helix-turn-helix transcriptional regulator n=1 Tax=Cohnella faecalis TaxID=2315694 RepID=UPI00360E06AF